MLELLTSDRIGHFSALELVYVLIAVVGLWLAWLNGSEAYKDYRALGGAQNGRRRIAIGSFRREALRGFVNILFGSVGIYAGTVPPNPNATVLGLGIAGILILGTAVYNLNSYLDRQDRIYLMRWGLQARDEHGRFTKGE